MPDSHDNFRSKLVDIAVADYLEAIERGAPPDREAFLARHFEIAGELREFLDDYQAVNQVMPGQSAGASTNGGAHSTDGKKYLAPVLPLPRTFGDFELLEEVARGGMGVVYKARQQNPDRIVALKMILTGQLASQADVDRFSREAHAAAALDHSHIVPIFEVGQHDGQHYFTMGYVAGESLAQRVLRGPLPAREAASLIAEVTLAVHYAHQQGIIHRDLKPANILLEWNGRVRVTDFGLAKRQTDESGLTCTGQLLGTPSFMSPEQVSGDQELIGPASDVYSLGATLYMLLTGRPPFQAASTIDTLKQVAERDPVPPREFDVSIPRDLETIVLKTLAKAQATRYGTAREMNEDLNRFLSDRPIFARRATSRERLVRWCRRNPLVASLATIAAVALSAATIGATVAAVQSNRLAERELQRASELAESSRQRQTRALKNQQEINDALAEATRLREQAKGPDGDLLIWAAAREQATRASSLVASGESDGELARRVQELLQQFAADDADRRLIVRLEEIRSSTMMTGSTDTNWYAFSPPVTEYKTAFENAGFSPQRQSADEAVAWLRERSQQARDALIVAIDAWNDALSDSDTDHDCRKVLSQVLHLADPDQWRTRMRQARATADVTALIGLARDPDVYTQSPITIDMLGRYLADVAKQHEELNIATEVLRNAQRRHAGDFWINYDLASQLMARRPPDAAEAIRFLTAATAIRPNSMAGHAQLGRALWFGFGEQQIGQAVESLRQAVRVAPDSAVAHSMLAWMLATQGNVDDAIAEYRKAISLNPEDHIACHNYYSCLTAKGEPEKTVATLRDLVQERPASGMAHHTLAEAFRDQKRIDDAIAEYQQAIHFSPNYLWSHWDLAALLLQQRRLDEAVAMSTAAVLIAPHAQYTNDQLQGILKEYPDKSRAVAVWRDVVSQLPRSPLAHASLGDALIQVRRVDEAIASYMEALRYLPSGNQTSQKVRNAVGRADEVEQAALTAFEKAKILTKLAIGQFRAGQWTEAIASLARSEELAPDKRLAFNGFFLAMAHWHLEHKGDARVWYERSVVWMKTNLPNNDELSNLRSEAEQLLGTQKSGETR